MYPQNGTENQTVLQVNSINCQNAREECNTYLKQHPADITGDVKVAGTSLQFSVTVKPWIGMYPASSVAATFISVHYAISVQT